MPIIEYRCLDCLRGFEFLHRTASPEAACPACGGQKLERQISLCGVNSEASQASNLSAAHARAARKRADKQRSEHAQHHEHFGDSPAGGTKH